MDKVNANKYFLNNLASKIKSDWNNKKNLQEYLNTLNYFKGSQLGKFNSTFFLIGLASSHLFLIYSQKKVLHQMEQKAIPHLGLVLGVGVLSGLVVGSIYGSSISNTRQTDNIEGQLKERISKL